MRDLVFIVGLGRSGTTLLRSILGKHPDVAVTPELAFFSRIMPYRRCFDLASREGRHQVAYAIRYLAMNHKDPMWSQVIARLDEVVDRVVSEGFTWKDIFLILLQQFSDKPLAQVFVTKTPANIFMLPVIWDYFPGAYVIHMIRDPRAVVASHIQLGWSNSPSRLAVRWAAAVDSVRQFEARGAQFMELKYEDLTSDPERYIADLCRFIGIDFRSTMLDVKRTHTAYRDLEQDRGICTAMPKYHEVLDENSISLISYLASPTLYRKGYDGRDKYPHSSRIAMFLYKKILRTGYQLKSYLKRKGALGLLYTTRQPKMRYFRG